ncbi:MAG: hypothetical protein ACJ0RV_01090 [Longimicrobiales bacterium]
MKYQDSEIFNLAQQLGLNPRHEDPFGQNPPPLHIWTAQCPHTNHYIFINLEKDLYYCGWCKRGGGPSSLLDFKEERKEKSRREREEFAARQAVRSLDQEGF